MRDFIQSIFIILIEMACYKIYLETFCDYKNQNIKKKSFIMLGILSIPIYIIASIFYDFFLVKVLVVVLTESLIAMFFFKIRFKKILLLTTIYQGLLFGVDYLTLVVYSFIFLDTMETVFFTQTQFLFASLGKTIVFLAVVLIHKYWTKKTAGVLGDFEWLKFLSFPVVTIFIIIAAISNLKAVPDTGSEKVFWMIAFGVLGMNIVVYNLLQDIADREWKIREIQIAEIEMHNQLQLYQMSSENYEKQMEKLHENKNQIECMQALVHAGRYDDLEKYLNQIRGELHTDLDSIDTHHAVVNAVINSKYQEAVKSNIIVVFKLNDLSGIQMEEKDLVVILSNLMDNAIEACQKCDGKRLIKIKMILEKNNLVFSVSNTYNGVLHCHESIFKTTKNNEYGNHGIGIKNVIRVIEKYEGSYVIRPQENEFYFSIMIPQKIGEIWIKSD